jgi:hypothetical protein
MLLLASIYRQIFQNLLYVFFRFSPCFSINKYIFTTYDLNIQNILLGKTNYIFNKIVESCRNLSIFYQLNNIATQANF